MPLESKVIVEKQAGEKILAGMDFGRWLSSGETITSITSITITSSDPNASTPVTSSQTITGTNITFFVTGGTAGVRYTIEIEITTNVGQILIGKGPLKVVAS